MLLRSLISRFDPSRNPSEIPDLEILGIHDDSRQVRRGDLFVARPGTRTDGREFIADAAAKGAVAAVVQTKLSDCPLPQVIVKDASTAASIVAAMSDSDTKGRAAS